MSISGMYSNPKHDFVSPLRSVGTVVSNGKVSQEMVTAAYTNRTPRWALADGTFQDTVGVMKRGEIIYAVHDNRGFGPISCTSTDPQYIDRENTTLKGLSIICGQGDSALSNFDFMSTIQILGIVEMSNDQNKRPLLNVVSGGIHDVRNNGNETINVGDSVYAYAPEPHEVRKGGGKNQHADEKAGVAKLWYKPYHPELHRYQLKQIYECLRDVNSTKGYLPKFRESCNKMIDGTSGMSMVMVAKLLPELRTYIKAENLVVASPINDAKLLSFMLARIGHSEFVGHASYNKNLKAEIRDALFVPFSVDSKNKTVFLFDDEARQGVTKEEKALMLKLNGIQQRSTALYQESMAYFVNQIKNLIVGQAKSTARPGMDFSLMLTLQ